MTTSLVFRSAEETALEEVVSEAETVSEIMLPVSEEETASEEAARREIGTEEEMA